MNDFDHVAKLAMRSRFVRRILSAICSDACAACFASALPASRSCACAKFAFESNSVGMKFSRYGTPFFTRLNRTFCCGIVISFVLKRSSAGKAPVFLKNAVIRPGVCMNMMKSASTSGYFVHAVMPTVCDVDPSRPA